MTNVKRHGSLEIQGMSVCVACASEALDVTPPIATGRKWFGGPETDPNIHTSEIRCVCGARYVEFWTPRTREYDVHLTTDVRRPEGQDDEA